MDKHDTVGIDCVAMCVNDIICCGAKPLYFLDYIAVGKNIPERIASIVSGVAEGCVQAGCALLGGETAEMPDFYKENEYDIAGFTVGIVDKDHIIDGSKVDKDDIIIGLASSGVHSNGFSLVRRVFDVENQSLSVYVDDLSTTLGESLLTPTKIYVKPILALLEKINVKAISHITGGGFFENIPRAIQKNFSAKIDLKSLDIPPIFKLIQQKGSIPEIEMFNIFNMGTGMCIVVSKDDADQAVEVLNKHGERAKIIGQIISGENEVILC
jgi:phosphoribosylformylglycinamidine cyclo-ligase